MRAYLYMFGILSMISPLTFAFFALDFDNLSAFWISFSIHFLMFFFGILMFNYLQNGNAFNFSLNKWKIYRQDVKSKEMSYNPLWGMGQIERNVIVDIYRREKIDGTYEYKSVLKH